MSSTKKPGDQNSDFSTDLLDSAIVEYLEACDAGNPPDRDEFLRKYSAVADELREFLDDRNDMDRMMRPIRQFQKLVEPSHQPEEFGEYTLLDEIGRGGMGVIYAAEQKSLKRHVALKMIAHHELRSEQARRRFQSEVEAAATLEHPNIVRIYDVGQVDDRPFFTMKLISGGSLKEVLDDGPLSSKNAAELAQSIALAIHYAHQRGILHRDLKPANILMDSRVGSESDSDVGHAETTVIPPPSSSAEHDWVPMITDFGLAKRLDEDGGLTVTGAVLGTPSFMSPEQASGGTAQLTTATDTYGIGAILYNMLTGEPPFVGDTALQVTQDVISKSPSRIRQSNSNVDLDLETICLKCLEKDPDLRYESASALADDLRRYLDGEPILARRSGPMEHVIKWARRNKAYAGLLAAVATLVVVGLVGSILFSWKLSQLVESRGVALDKLSAQEKETSAQRDEAIHQSFEARSAEVAARRSSGEVGRRFKAIAAAKEAVASLNEYPRTPAKLFELRSETAGCLGLADIEEIGRWNAPTTGDARYAFNPNLSQFAVQQREGQPVKVFSTAELMEAKDVDRVAPKFEVDLGKGGFGQRMRFSPDGRYLLFHTVRPNRFLLYDIERQETILEQDSDYGAQVASRDDQIILITLEAKNFVVRELPSLEEIKTFRAPDHCRRIRISPDGKRLACLGDRRITVLSTEDGLVEWRHLRNFGGIDEFAWHPTESILAFPNLTETELWRIGEDEPWKTLKGNHPNRVFKAMFSMDGKILATSSWAQQTHFWDVSSGELLFSTSGVFSRFSDDGLRVAMGNSQVGIWRFATGSVRKTVAQAQTPNAGTKPIDLAIHPNNRWVALAQENGVRLFDLDSGAELAELPGGIVASVRFHPNGKSLYAAGRRLVEWKLQETDSELIVGPPKTLDIERFGGRADFETLDLDSSGRYLAVNYGRTSIVDLHNDSARPIKTPGSSKGVTVSNEAKLVATGNHHGSGVAVFDGASGEKITHLPTPTHARAQLNHDGSRLVVTYSGTADLYETKEWKPIRHWHDSGFEIAWPASFSPDGRYLLLTTSEPRGTLVIDAGSGTELIRIPGKAGTAPRDAPARMTTDGQLVMVKSGNGLEVWDIAVIHAELKEMGLAWSEDKAPDFGREYLFAHRDAKPPPKVRVVWDESHGQQLANSLSSIGGRWSNPTARETLDNLISRSPNDPLLRRARGTRHAKQWNWAQALADHEIAIQFGETDDAVESLLARATILRELNRPAESIGNYRQYIALRPRDTGAKRRLAWELSLRPHALLDANEALRLGESSIGDKLDPFSTKVLGAAHLRTNELQKAVDTLRMVATSVTGENKIETLGADFLLCLAQHRLGKSKAARTSFDSEVNSASGHNELSSEQMRAWMMLKRECEEALEIRQQSLRYDACDLVSRSWCEHGKTWLQHYNHRRTSSDQNDASIVLNLAPRGETDSLNLFWKTKRAHGELHIEFDSPTQSNYRVLVNMVTAADYGQLNFAINGVGIGETFDGFSEPVLHGNVVTFTNVPLRRGTNVLTLTNVGKSGQSWGHHAGVESIELHPTKN